MDRIASLSPKNNNNGWIGYHGINYGCAVVVHEMDDEVVRAQYVVNMGEEDQESTPVREYVIRYKKIDRGMYGDEYDPEGNGTHGYIVIQAMSIALDMFVRRGR